MKHLSQRIVPITLLLLSAMPLGSGCQTSKSATRGYDLTVKTTDAMTACQQSATQLKTQASTTLRALDSVLEKPAVDPKPQFEIFSKELAELTSGTKEFNSRFEAMKTNSVARFGAWQQENTLISDADIREKADKRRADALEEMAKAERMAGNVKSQAEPMQSLLADVQRYLKSDLSPAGIESAKSMVKKARSMNSDFGEAIDDLAKELDVLGKRFAPAKTPATPAPTQT